MNARMLLQLIVVSCALAAATAEYGFKMFQNTRVVDGDEASEGQFPHQVSLQVRFSSSNSQHFCGGSIIAPRLIATAAHCIDAVLDEKLEEYLVVKAGLLDLQSNNASKVQTVKVEKFYRHSEFAKGLPGPYDIGVLVLKSSLEFNEIVRAAVLPKDGASHSGTAIVSGWGATKPPGSDTPRMLQYAELPIISHETCKPLYDSPYHENPVATSNICAGSLKGGPAVCRGDSGGGLVQKNEDGRYELIGVVSWGMVPCGRKNSPGVFTKVSAYINNIDRIKSFY